MQRKTKESALITDAARSDAAGSTVLNPAVSQSSQDRIRSVSQQCTRKNNCTDVSQLDGRHDNRVVVRQRKTVDGVTASSHDNNCCLLDVSCDTKTRKPASVVQKCSNMVNRSAKSVQRHLSGRIYPDVLLTPLSDRRASLYARPRYIVDDVGLLPSAVGSAVTPDNSQLSAKAAEVSSPQAAVPLCISTDGKLSTGNVHLVSTRIYKNAEMSNDSVVSVPSRVVKNVKMFRGIVEEDVIENVMPLSMEMSGNCSLIPLQYLTHQNASADEDTEIDVCLRSFWDEASDGETDNNFNVSFNFGGEQVSDDCSCRVGNRLTKKLEVATSKQTSSAKKRRITKSIKTTISRQNALKNMASATGHRNSTRLQRKAESNQHKLSNKDQKGAKACVMTLRARKKVDYAKPNLDYAQPNCKPQLHSQQKKTATRSCKEKNQSSRIQTKTNNNCRRSSRKKYQKSYNFCAVLKNMASATGHRNSRPQRKAESNQHKLSNKDQKGAKAEGSSASRSCIMTLRARKKVDYAQVNCKPQLHRQQKKTATRSCKKKSQSSGIQTKTNNNCKRSSRKKCQKSYGLCAAQPVAARTRGRSYSESASPLVSSRVSGQKNKRNNQAGRKDKADEKCGQTYRKRIRSASSTKPPSKKPKLCKKDNNAGSITRQQPNVCQAASRVTRKESKATHSTKHKNKHSVKQSVSKREAGKRGTRTRKVASAELARSVGNTEIVASDSSTSNKTNSAGDAVSSSVNNKKTRSVAMHFFDT